ncbi:class I SAM-dependent methyltransferase [Candidatus Woesearchaeota archaeon]|jgi:SAM-dependent methyltransferase|nr:class I SAM-dependent methyltransferase [Candidatus Woesearchaeota archaeon]MBT5400331.1 class I SAM-dependent methyltransferase [bacterium]
MRLKQEYECPMCGLSSNLPRVSFPYYAKIDNFHFKYLRCKKCSTVYVNPPPSSKAIALMYKGSEYHYHYHNPSRVEEYQKSANLLFSYLNKGAKVLDYGCGDGFFLKLLSCNSFYCTGVEYNTDAVKYVKNNEFCEVMSTDSFQSELYEEYFDAIHLGDVLEHIPRPADTLNYILKSLKFGGTIFIEGPLENNPSLVYFSSYIFGFLKNIFYRNTALDSPPYHLFRVGGRQQYDFFLNRIDTDLELKYWRIYDTGWPYVEGKFIKYIIAKIAILFSGKKFFNTIFGNRFQAVFIKRQI